MKVTFTTLLAGTILAITTVTTAVLPALAINTNAVIQQPTNGHVKTETLLLAGKSGKSSTTHQVGKEFGKGVGKGVGKEVGKGIGKGIGKGAAHAATQSSIEIKPKK